MALDSEKLLAKLEPLAGYTHLSPKGRQLLRAICEGEPVRTVGRRSLMAVHGELYSEDVDSTVQFESIVERTFVLDSLCDPDTLGVLCQPAQLRVLAHDKRGRQSHRSITPDYIEFKAERFSFIEVKPLDEVRKLGEKYPADWVQHAGTWTFLPGQVAAQTMGFHFRVQVHGDEARIWQANALIRVRLRLSKVEPMSSAKRNRILTLLNSRPRTVLELCECVGGVTAGQLLQAVEAGVLHGMLRLQVFDDGFLLFANATDVERHLAELRQHAIVELPAGPMLARYLRASSKELAYALRRQEAFIKRQSSPHKKDSAYYAAVRRIRQATSESAPAIAAFVPNFSGRGGKGRPVPEDAKNAFLQFVKADYFPKVKGRASPGRAVAAFENDLPEYRDAMSDETMRKLYHQAFAPEMVALATRGLRGYHATRARTDGSKVNSRAKICGFNTHLDGVRVDARSDKSSNGVVLIYYPLVDDSNSYILSRGISINRAHQFGVNLALRDCVARHGFLPPTILRDTGSENNNRAEPEKVALLGVTFQHRPVSAPRHGGADESFHGKLNEYASSLPGSTYHDAAGRAADGAKKSRRHARFTVEELIAKLDHWCFEVWNKMPTGADGLSREDAFKDHLKRYEDLLVRHSVTPLLAYATGYPIDIRNPNPRRGIRTHGQVYSSQALTTMLQQGVRPKQARLDCVDPSILWFDNGLEYVPAYSFDNAKFQAMGIAQRVLYIEDMLNDARDRKAVAKTRRRQDSEPEPSVATSTTPEPAMDPCLAAAPMPAPLKPVDKAPPRKRVTPVPIQRLGATP